MWSGFLVVSATPTTTFSALFEAWEGVWTSRLTFVGCKFVIINEMEGVIYSLDSCMIQRCSQICTALVNIRMLVVCLYACWGTIFWGSNRISCFLRLSISIHSMSCPFIQLHLYCVQSRSFYNCWHCPTGLCSIPYDNSETFIQHCSQLYLKALHYQADWYYSTLETCIFGS